MIMLNVVNVLKCSDVSQGQKLLVNYKRWLLYKQARM